MNELVGLINQANEILAKYNLRLTYCQFDIHDLRPLEPKLFFKENRISHHFGFIRFEIVDNILVFFLGDFSWDVKSLKEYNAKLKEFQDISEDIAKLNELKLYVSNDLRTLH